LPFRPLANKTVGLGKLRFAFSIQYLLFYYSFIIRLEARLSRILDSLHGAIWRFRIDDNDRQWGMAKFTPPPLPTNLSDRSEAKSALAITSEITAVQRSYVVVRRRRLSYVVVVLGTSLFDRFSAQKVEKANRDDDKDRKPIEKKNKKKKKTKRKKDGKRATAVKKEPGRAIIARLRLADNGIDGFHVSSGSNREALIQFLQLCTSSVHRSLQIVHSPRS